MILHKDITHWKAIQTFATMEDRFNAVHNYKYSYNKAVYKGNKVKIVITCPIHGDFEQAPGDHVNGRGCSKCGGTNPLTTKEFVEQAQKIHKNKYSYVSTIFTSSKDKVTIICKTHGEFEQLPHNHLNGYGCIKCKWDNQRISHKTFLEKVKRIHRNRYTYGTWPLAPTTSTYIDINCPKHGWYRTSISSHLSGSNCIKCVNEAQTKTTEQFILESKNKYGDLFTYDNTIYVTKDTKLTLHCTACSTDFETTPNNHLQVGMHGGCSRCSKTGFDTTKPGLLYYFKVTNGVNNAWKIGITNKSIQDRYSIAERARMTNIISTWYASGKDAYNEEQRLLKEFEMYKYYGPKLLQAGNTELFTIDILGKL